MRVASRPALLTLVFSVALFLSAGLMFSVQPMVGKMLLPVVGGTPAGWIVAMAFFQLALLAGYAIAYGMTRLSPGRHGIAYVALLAIGLLVLPVAITTSGLDDTPGAWGTFFLLAATIGLPFLALSTTATTLQRLFAATPHPAARDPYFLYAASNLGSFAGLLLYPLLIEPNFDLGLQNTGWLWFYGVLIVLAAVCVFFISGQTTAEHAENTETPPPAPLERQRVMRWVMWGFIPASLLMGYTSFITRDIYSAPLIWVLPLGIYLLTFVLAFRSPALITSSRLAMPHLVAVMISLVLITLATSIFRTSMLPVVLHLLALGVIAMTFHVRLYEDRPLANPAALATFYLSISLGGALAGLFNAFVAPFIFNQSLELPLILFVSLLFHPRLRAAINFPFFLAMAFTLLAIAGYVTMINIAPENTRAMLMMAVLAVVIGVGHPRAMLIAGLVLMGIYLHIAGEGTIARSRNFYGNIVVYDRPAPFKLPDGTVLNIRYINHGTTLHGFQVLNAANTLQPTSYYGAVQGIYDLMQPQRVAVLGLGTGTMHCLAGPNTATTFVEIDPAVIDAAYDYFTYLADCHPGKPARILTGDGRLEMQKLNGETFDMIAVDVFSSDYIPAHLMTREALALYIERLEPNGAILFHISNNFFDLAPALTLLAQDAGLDYRLMENMRVSSLFEKPSRWFIMSPSPALLERIAANDARWRLPPTIEGLRLWTDDYTDYLGVLKPEAFALKTILSKKN